MKLRASSLTGPKPQPEPALDQQQIVQAALSLLDQAGFDGLTMRGLAQKLGIKAASLYWHVSNKQELLSLLADEICAPMRAPDRKLPWRQQLEELANECRRVALSPSGCGARAGPQWRAGGTAPVAADPDRAKNPARRRLWAQRCRLRGFLLNNYVTMFVLEETQNTPDEAVDGAEAAAAGAQHWLAALPATEYPSVVALADYLLQPDADERFQFGIEILRSGLETRLERQGGDGPAK